MPWRGPKHPLDFPTLGWLVLAWTHAHLPSPADESQPLVYTDEQARRVLRWFEIDPDSGEFVYERLILEEGKGVGKSPFIASLDLAEFAGPVCFDGWDSNGEPVGVPWGTGERPPPWVQIAAVSEDQTENTYGALFSMLSANDGKAATALGIDSGRTRLYLKGRPGRLEPVTASAGSREGQRTTHATLDEALALDTPLPTPTGWTTMGDVSVGDRLVGADGMPVEVVKTTDVQDDRPCWRVNFEDGTSIVASDGHLWLSRVASSAALPQVRSTWEMVADTRRFRVPRAAPIKTPDLPLPLDPYVLGLWLGDGTRGQGYITAADEDAAFYIEQIRGGGDYARQRTLTGERTGSIALGYRAGPYRNASSIKQRLRLLGVLYDKAIPAAYLRGSIDQRTAMVQGLMDTDGHVSKEGTCVFVNTSTALAEGMAELLRSLGQTAHISWRADERARIGGCYKVGFTPAGGLQPFRLPRKVSRVRGHRRGEGWVTIRSIEPVPTVPVRCVAVDAADHLFLAGEGCHVTHNTHLWTPTNGGVKLAKTLRRNVAKMGGRSTETTNAPILGGRSVAEGANPDEPGAGTLHYRRRPEIEPDPSWTDDQLREALTSVYGDAWWVDIERRVREIRNPANPWQDSLQFWFNIRVASEGRAVDPRRWEELVAGTQVEPRTSIGIGFEGGNATVLRACTAEGHSFILGHWSRPKGAKDWSVPRSEVHEVLARAFDTYNVQRMLCDPPNWRSEVEEWAATYSEDIVLAFETNQPRRFAPAVDRWLTGLREGTHTHDGDGFTSDSVRAAHLRKVRLADPDDDSHTMYVLTPSGDGRPIAGAVADVLALEAAMTMPELVMPGLFFIGEDSPA